RLNATTAEEALALLTLYGADPARVVTVHPGVDLDVFRPTDVGAARARLGLPADGIVLLSVAATPPLRAPALRLRAATTMIESDPSLRERLVVAIVGGPSGSGLAAPKPLHKLAAPLGIAALVRFEPPVPQHDLADWYRAATVTVVPSHSESFGLVALESQACGTPVVGAAVGGLRTAVADGLSGVLIDGHHPDSYADVLRRIAIEPRLRAHLARGACEHAVRFGWSASAATLSCVYCGAVAQRRE